MKIIGYVYVITNKVNNKKYIGITKNTIVHRWRSHKNTSKKSNRHLYLAFKKYGIENFEISLVKTCYSDAQLYNSEIYFIKLFRTSERLFGYNKSSGGEVSSKGVKGRPAWNKGKKGPEPWNKGKKGCMPIPHNKGIRGVVKLSQEARDKISKANKGNKRGLGLKQTQQTIETRRIKNTGQKRSEEFKKRLSELMLSNPAYTSGGKRNKGKIRTEDHKEKISIALKSRQDNKGEYHKMAKLNVDQVLEIREIGRTISSAKIASKYGVSKATILQILNRKSWTHI